MSASPLERVRVTGATVAVVGLAGSGAAAAAEPRLGLVGGAIVLGWTRLVGL